jgi:hypothetical protein
MLKPSLLKSTWFQSIGLEEPIAQAKFSHPYSSAKPYDPPRVSKKSVRPTFLRSFSTFHLDVGAKRSIEVYGLLQQASDCFFKHFDFLSLGFLGFANFCRNFRIKVSATH